MAEATVLEWDQTYLLQLPWCKPLSFCLQFEALQAQVTSSETIFQVVDTPHHQHQREADSEFIVVEDLLVREEGDWLTMGDG